jgi:TatD DNase family protein
MLQDTHIHLQDIKNSGDITAFLKEIRAKGFKRLFATAITPEDWPIVRDLALKNPDIVPFFGIHPWFIDSADNSWREKIRPYLDIPYAGIGETGLDRSRKNIEFDLQKKIFSEHLLLAKETRKPFVVHSVRAWEEAIGMIQQYAPDQKFLAHSFNGSSQIMFKIVSLGGYISISVKQFMKAEESFKEMFNLIPLERIVIETDFPYQVKWTRPNDYIEAVILGYHTAALWRNMPVNDFIKVIYVNGTVLSDQTAHR